MTREWRRKRFLLEKNAQDLSSHWQVYPLVVILTTPPGVRPTAVRTTWTLGSLCWSCSRLLQRRRWGSHECRDEMNTMGEYAWGTYFPAALDASDGPRSCSRKCCPGLIELLGICPSKIALMIVDQGHRTSRRAKKKPPDGGQTWNWKRRAYRYQAWRTRYFSLSVMTTQPINEMRKREKCLPIRYFPGLVYPTMKSDQIQ